jgi:hypothetical protein
LKQRVAIIIASSFSQINHKRFTPENFAEVLLLFPKIPEIMLDGNIMILLFLTQLLFLSGKNCGTDDFHE